MPNITLITMGQGNVRALKRTIDCFLSSGICNEVIFGDMLIFDDDRERLKEIQQGVPHILEQTYGQNTAHRPSMKIIPMDFNFTFKYGFAATLNRLASFASNDLVLYMNVSEIIDNIASLNLSLIRPEYNCWYFNHAVETHQWIRCYNRKQLYWSGVIHEIVVPYGGYEYRRAPEPLFMMADTEKDMEDPFKAKVFNDIKELTYFNQYLKLVEDTEGAGATNMGWVQFAQQDYDSFRERLQAKKQRYYAFKFDMKDLYMETVFTDAEFELEKQESSVMINLQGIRKDIL